MARHRRPASDARAGWLRRRSQTPPTPEPAPPAEPTPTAVLPPVVTPGPPSAEPVPLAPSPHPAPGAGPADAALTGPIERVRAQRRILLDRVPVVPDVVTLDYPDGRRIVADCVYGGTEIGTTRQRWIAVVPEEAQMVNGMVIRVDRDTVLTLALRDRAVTP